MAELLTSVPKEFRTGKLHGLGNVGGDRVWNIYNSPLLAYQHDFDFVLNGARIEDLLRGKSDPVVVDLMAPTGTLADLFTHIPGDEKLGIAVSLEDLRDQGLKERDTRLGIFQVAGDITRSSTWKKIDKLLEGRKADLIMERAVGGLEVLPTHPGFYGVTLQRMWNMLSSEGAMLIQLPLSIDLSHMGISIHAWLRALNESEIVAVTDLTCHLFIQRSPSSPEHLPFPHEVLQKAKPAELQAVDNNPTKNPLVHLNVNEQILFEEHYKKIFDEKREIFISFPNGS